MDSHARCWLVVAAVSPLAAAFSFWSLVTLHAYRRQWRTVDVLFVAAVSQEFVHSLFLLGHSVLNLTQPDFISICSLFVWATVSIRTFQVATLTTLALDRAFTLVWPYRYRLTVRRHQVRYHLVAMAIVSSLVGVASVFAQNVPSHPSQASSINSTHPYKCLLLPFDTDPEFAIFLVTLQSVLATVSFGGLIYVQLKLCLPTKSIYASPSSTITTNSTAGVDRIRIPIKPYLIMDNNVNGGSPLNGSDRGRQWIINSSSSMRREAVRSIKEFRWGAVLPIIITCHFVNHFPYLVMVTMARFTFWVPPLWLEGGSTYLALVQALLLPALLWGIDPIYKTAVSHTLVRKKQGKKDALSEYMEEGSRAMNGRAANSLPNHNLPNLNFDTALAYSTFVCSSDTLDKKELLLLQSHEGSRWGTATHDELSVLTSFYHPQMGDSKADLENLHDHLNAIKCRTSQSPEPVYCDPAEIVQSSSDNQQLKDNINSPGSPYASAVEDHIYATVSDRYDKSTLSVKGDPRRLREEEDNFDVDDDDDSSVTTSASDDFEFHLTRPHFNPHPLNLSGHKTTSACEMPNRLRCSVMNHVFKNSHASSGVKQNSTEVQSSATPSRASTLSIRSDCQTVKAPGVITIAGNQIRPRLISSSDDCKKHNNNDYVNESESLNLKLKNTSLSMNDLDLLSIKTEESTEELIYVLTGRSESTLSLYKITNGEDSETLDRPLFRYAKHLPNHQLKVDKSQNNNSSRYSTWSLQEPDSMGEWDSAVPEQGNESCAKVSADTSTLDPFVPNIQSSSKTKKNFSNATFQKHYHRNPFLVKNRIRNNSRNGNKMKVCNGGVVGGLYSSTNWKYKANNSSGIPISQRQDFPWKNKVGRNGSRLFPSSVALPYQFPPVHKQTRYSSLNNVTNGHTTNSFGYNNNSGISRDVKNNSVTSELAFQKKFVSDFL